MELLETAAAPAGLLGGCRVDVRISGGLAEPEAGWPELDVEDRDVYLEAAPVRAGLLTLWPK